jgi:DNA invertase Pin-like site-specific DNA recombinase
MATKKLQAVAYIRTSSATNVGADKDSDKRQFAAIAAYAKASGVEIVEIFRDDAVKGADMIETRPGFAAMLQCLLSNGVRTIVVENASRFARDIVVQETGYEMLKARGITLIAADKPDAFLDDGPTATMIRQILGVVSQFEKAMVVNKLRGARDRKRATGVKVEGRKSHAELRPETVELARQMHRKRMSLREISAELFADGHISKNGKPFTAQSIANMLTSGPDGGQPHHGARLARHGAFHARAIERAKNPQRSRRADPRSGRSS